MNLVLPVRIAEQPCKTIEELGFPALVKDSGMGIVVLIIRSLILLGWHTAHTPLGLLVRVDRTSRKAAADN